MSSELASPMLYIHPPLSIIGYAFIVAFAIFLFRKQSGQRHTKTLGTIAWALTFAGLITGMLWAQLAWGSYWSWDPKETLTLVLFVATSGSMLSMFERKLGAAKWWSVLACVFVVITGMSSFILTGLHSFIH